VIPTQITSQGGSLMQRQKKKEIVLNSDGFAVVEATVVYPIMFMVFFAL